MTWRWFIPRRWYSIAEGSNDMTTYIEWFGRRWRERPCNNWIEEMLNG